MSERHAEPQRRRFWGKTGGGGRADILIRNPVCYFFRELGSASLGWRPSIRRGPRNMRIRLPFAVLVLVFLLSRPGFASTVRRPVSRVHHHNKAGLRHAAAHRGSRVAAGRRGVPVRHRALETRSATRQATIPTLAPVHFVPPLRGSRESLLRQNVRDTAEGLVRIQDDEQLNAMRADRELVLVPVGSGLRINPDLPYNRRYCRPWTARFLGDLARVHYARFHNALQVNSAVRTVAFQRALIGINGNAAAADGDLASPHLTGAAVDIGKKGLSVSEIAWMRAWLLPLQTSGKIDVEEEFYQACFHITVYSSYAPPVAPRVPRRRSSTTLLAAGVR